MDRYLLLLFLICLTSSVNASSFEGKVIHIYDSDILAVSYRGQSFKVRLLYIDAPEHDQRYGSASRSMLQKIVGNRDVRIEYDQKDKYGRLLGLVYLDGYNVNATMVDRGMAWVYRQYSDDARLLELEQRARNAKKGLWHDAAPIAPWKWRHR